MSQRAWLDDFAGCTFLPSAIAEAPRPMATWKLTIEDDEGQKTVVPLVRDEYTVGRREGHTLRLTERNVSRDHARLKREGETFVIEDIGSYNGVFVNGHRLREPRPLGTGDLILIGDYRIEAHDEDQATRAIPAVTPPMPPVVANAAAAAAAAVAPAPPAAAPPIDAPRARIVVLSGEGAGKEHSIEKPRAILGRGDDVAVFVNDSSVSRHHCELRLLEDGRVEVVDLGSQNGVRVAGREVTKGLLSPGAIFEAGDVILKYVPAGERFVYDEATAAAARTAVAKARSAASASPLAWVVALLVIAAAAAGGVMLARQSKTGADASAEPSSTKSTSGLSAAASEAIERGYKKLQSGDTDAAHDEVKDLVEPTKLRADKHYAEIEDAWAKARVVALEKESDPAARKRVLQAIVASGASKDLRAQASDLLSEKSASWDAGGAEPVLEEPSAVASAVPTSTTPPPPVPTIAPTNPIVAPTIAPTAPPTTSSPAPKPSPTPPVTPPAATGCSSFAGDYIRANKASDYSCVKSILMPALNSGSITSTQAKYLKAACVSLGDTDCATRAAKKLL